MKVIDIKFGIFLLFVLMVFPVMAEEFIFDDSSLLTEELELELESVSAGTTPDSLFHGLDVAFDNIGYAFSGDKETKGLLIAQERLEELKVMVKEGKTKEVVELRESHQNALDKVRLRVEGRLRESESEEDLKAAIKVETALGLQEGELEELKERLSSLTPEQRRLILKELLGIEGNLHDAKGRIEDAESDSMVRFEEKLGKSRLEIRNALSRLREDKKLKAEIIDSDTSVVTVEYKYKYRNDEGQVMTVEEILQKTLDQVKTTDEEARSSTKIGDSDDDSGSDEVVEVLEAIEEEIKKAPITGQVTGSSDDDSDSDSDDDDSKGDSDSDDDDEDDSDSDDEDSDSDDNSSDDDEAGNDSDSNGDETDSDEDSDGDNSHFDDDNFDDVSSERLRVKVDLEQKKDGEMRAEVQFRLRFLSGATPEEIYSSIVEQTNALTLEQLISAARIKEENNNKGNKERRVEVKIRERDGQKIAEIRFEWDGLKDSFRLETESRTEILEEVALRVGATTSDVESAMKRFEQKETKDKERERDDKDGERDDKDEDDKDDDGDDDSNSGRDKDRSEDDDSDDDESSGSNN